MANNPKNGGPNELLHRPVIESAQRPVTVLREDQTVGDALTQLRAQNLSEKIVYFYVIDQDRRLVGVVPVRRLLMSQPEATMATLMVGDVISVSETTSLLEASEVLLSHRLMALPVVDADFRIVGVLDITLFSDEVSSLAHQHEVENAFQLIGVHVSLGRNVSLWSSFRDRFPWLLCNIIGGFACALILARHETMLSTFTLLAMFIPVLLAVGESVSMQSMTLTLQASHENQALLLWNAIRRELVASLGLGLSSGLLVGAVSYIWRGQAVASLVVGGCLLVSVIVACTLGVLIPGIIRALRANPKIAAGPVALAVADVVTLVLLFVFADSLLS